MGRYYKKRLNRERRKAAKLFAAFALQVVEVEGYVIGWNGEKNVVLSGPKDSFARWEAFKQYAK